MPILQDAEAVGLAPETMYPHKFKLEFTILIGTDHTLSNRRMPGTRWVQPQDGARYSHHDAGG
jgi:hypothetical protein